MKGSKANRRRAPLQPLPAMEEPFQRVAVDIVGPLRRTKKGNRYILTLMDFATRYPEAIPLRRIDAETVAEALCTIFTRLGISDQGTQFMSTLMKCVMDLLQVQQLKTSPYHPETDGMLERFHSTLKHVMQKRGEASKEWDDFLPYVCFAYRDSVHAATGYTPFQLLFGRDVRGPLSLLKSQLTGETKGSQPVVEFLEKMKSRLQHAWEKASENDEQAKLKSKNYHDKKSCHRQFQPGDQVLVFEPGEDKFEAQWQGPYTVESRINNLVYRIVTPERRKKLRQYHVNSMKEWKTPPAVMAVTYCREEADEVLGDGPELYPFERGCKESPTLNTQLSTSQQVQAKALLEEFEDVFSNEPGNTQLATHSINTGDAKPVYNQPRRVPQAWQAKIREEIHTMLGAEVIEPSTSPWTSPIVLSQEGWESASVHRLPSAECGHTG